MRVEFVRAVQKVLAADAESVFFTGDLGYNALEDIAKSMGHRFINAGVAEQNMIGMSAGVALAGYRPWVYSIAPFVTYRCLEQIRNDVCFHRLPVRLVGNGGGYTYGMMGSTHHALEDIAVLKSLPGMQLFFPTTADHVEACVDSAAKLEGPSYLRLAISGFPGNAQPLEENPKTLTRWYARGRRATILGIGHAAQIALAAHNDGLDADIFGLARFPLDLVSDAEILQSVARTGRVIILEEHYLPGSVAESLALALPRTGSLEVLSAHYSPDQRYGTSVYHLRQCGLTPQALLNCVAKGTNARA